MHLTRHWSSSFQYFEIFAFAGETDAVNDTTISAVVTDQPEDSERGVPESDDDFSSPSLGMLYLTYMTSFQRYSSNPLSVERGRDLCSYLSANIQLSKIVCHLVQILISVSVQVVISTTL